MILSTNYLEANMQVLHLHKSIYKLSRVVSPEEKIDPYLLEIKAKFTR